MEIDPDEFIKCREIRFADLHSHSDVAQSASLLLNDIDGIISVDSNGTNAIIVTYNLLKLNLEIIEDALRTVGFHLDGSLLSKLKRALFYYLEETQLANLGYDHAETKSTTEIFINRYLQMQHGCRDERPEHYRRYN